MRGRHVRAAALAALALSAIGATTLADRKSGPQPAVREFAVVASRYKFTPDRIEVTQGDTVRVTVKSADSAHGFEIKKLSVDEYVPKGGRPVTVEFIANQAGEFVITCSEYCGKGHDDMKSMLVVKAASGSR